MISLPIVLASNSPRRLQLLQGSGFEVKQIRSHADESFPETMALDEVALYLAEKKMDAIEAMPDVVLTADTTVVFPEFILNKPQDENEVRYMLQQLSGRMHTVITGVCMRKGERKICFKDATEVYFAPLSEEIISHYIQFGNPYDKAGAYGIQDSIGYLGIEKIEGCFYNVMGLPVRLVYNAYQKICL